MTMRVTSGDSSSTSIEPRSPGARRMATSSIERRCSSCWSVVLVGTHMASRPSAIATSAAPGVSQAWPATSSPSNEMRAPGGSSAAKKRVSNRRGMTGGVTQRDSGTIRSVRSRRSSSSATCPKVASPPTSADLASDTERVGMTPPPSPGLRQQHAGLLEQLADRGDVQGDRRVRAPGRRPGRWPHRPD